MQSNTRNKKQCIKGVCVGVCGEYILHTSIVNSFMVIKLFQTHVSTIQKPTKLICTTNKLIGFLRWENLP